MREIEAALRVVEPEILVVANDRMAMRLRFPVSRHLSSGFETQWSYQVSAEVVVI